MAINLNQKNYYLSHYEDVDDAEEAEPPAKMKRGAGSKYDYVEERKAKENGLTLISSTATMADPVPAYSFASPRRQLFSFPPDMIASMLKNPSSHKGLLKLYQTCKYFYAKRPILIADSIEANDYGSYLTDFDRKDVSDLKVSIWATYRISFDGFEDNQLPKIFRSSVSYISVYNSQLRFDDFVLLCSKNTFHFSCCRSSRIFHSDMSKTSLDEILQYLPNIQSFSYIIDETCTLESLIKLNQIKFNNKLEYFSLEFINVHPTFDINLLCEFFMKNFNDDTQIKITPRKESKENLKFALRKLDPKWKNDANRQLRHFLRRVYPKWEEEIGK